MGDEQKQLLAYLQTLNKELAVGNATEHTHRPALKILLESIADKITATNEPQRIKCGAPDFILTKGALTVGYIETKDIGKSLDETEKTDQIKRYLDSLSNFILTDYIEFRWFIDGKLRLKARIGTADKNKIKHSAEGLTQASELLNSFFQHQAKGVGTAKDLALRMAKLAHLIRNLIINTFGEEVEKGSLHAQLAAFRENLIPDLSNEQFADMYAQTIVYGLFAARCNTDYAQNFTRQNAMFLLPRTNPFLQNLFIYIAGPKLDDRVAWAVDELVQVLAQAEMAEILKDFGKQMGKEDPVVHFYETFLKAYDPAVREMRGVYYTPEPVVSYIVRSIDYLLKTRFNKPQGLADPETLILDPAVGTATFLYKVIDEIHHSFVIQGQQGAWNNYVAEKLLPRLFGFEILMAPYAIAHFKIGLQLADSGYKSEKDQRLGIYLTNTLEEGFKKAEQLSGFNEYIVEEANAAAEIKKVKPIMAVLGNPPYSVSSVNKGQWINGLLEDYKKDLHEKKLNLDDDYIKFIRFAQWRIQQTGYGVIGFITNNSYISGLTHRRMRQYLLNYFSEIYILDLHGNSRFGSGIPGDENVFDIMQGVCIALFIKVPGDTEAAKVYYCDIKGQRNDKYLQLSETCIDSTEFRVLKPITPNFFFIPKDFSFEKEYGQYWSFSDIGRNISGIETKRDAFALDFVKETLIERIKDFVDNKCTADEIKDKYALKDNEWNVSEARASLRKNRAWEKQFVPCLYRPFETRYIVYNEIILSRTRGQTMNSLNKPNIGLIMARQTKEDFAVLTTNCVCTHKIVTVYDRSFVFPLYLYPAENELQLQTGRVPNLKPEFIKALSDKLGLKFVEDGKGDLQTTFGPEDILNYAYAIFHSPAYRTRYAEVLKIDFPRLPLTSNKVLFKALTEKGAELVALHLMESPILNIPITKYSIAGSNPVEKVEYKELDTRVYINKEQYFEGVPPEVWNFHVGGYQVCEKWLKDRKGRNLSYDDITHYQKIVVALKETGRLMTEIDQIIPGWPVE